MFKYLALYLALSVLVVNGIYVIKPGPKVPPTKGEVWPKPQFEKKDDYYYSFNPARFVVSTLNYTCDILTSAITRYSYVIKRSNKINSVVQVLYRKRKGANIVQRRHYDPFYRGRLRSLDIYLMAPCEHQPYFGMDESYDLTVGVKARLSSNSIWGILRGIETFSQLPYINDDGTEVRINRTHIADFPRYPHRGLMLDTSRHYLTVTTIKRMIDAMAMNKLNVFHWHIVDDQSFPYESQVFPELCYKGAYSYPTMIYTREDIALIIEYATERGIRVIPEFDVPGHTASWGVAYPNILTECYSDGKLLGLGPMNPINNATYTLLSELIKEVQKWFPDKYFHIGGDEVELECWESNPALQNYMKSHNMSASQLHGLFMEKVIPLLGSKSQPIVWQEVFDEGVPLARGTLIQVWKWDWVNDMIKILRSGHRLIFSSSWYLDHIKTGGDWIDFFKADPREMVSDKAGNSTFLDNIVGGEACMWGEVVDDSNAMTRVWPRASAAAERLWSPPMDKVSYKDQISDASSRLEEHACRMLRRGIKAQPPNGPGFCLGATLSPAYERPTAQRPRTGLPHVIVADD